MIRRRRRSRPPETFDGINITPFTDILLVLLIIFMIAGSALTPGALDLAELGEAGRPSSDLSQEKFLLVQVGSETEPRFTLAGQRLDWEQIEKLSPDTTVALRVEEQVRAQTVVSLVDRLAALGLVKVQWGPPVSASELQQ